MTIFFISMNFFTKYASTAMGRAVSQIHLHAFPTTVLYVRNSNGSGKTALNGAFPCSSAEEIRCVFDDNSKIIFVKSS